MALSSERRAQRQQHLVEAAQALIRERGDAGFSMAMLAERAGVSAATPYNLLGSKAEIMRLVVRADVAGFVRELEGETGATPLARLLIAADKLVDHYEGDRRFHVGLFRAAFAADDSDIRGILSAESWLWWQKLVEAAIDSKEIGDMVSPPILTNALLRMMGAVVRTSLADDWPAERFALEMSLSVRLVLASVGTPPVRDAMIGDIARLQAAIGEVLDGPPQPCGNR